MKKRELMILVVGVLLSVANVASATVVQGINIDFVAIGDAGNAGDTRGAASPSGAGSVAYGYSIGKYEITNGQWDTFVSAAGAPTGNPSNAYDTSASWTGTDVPTNEVSWYEAAQFCNYLTTGDKSQGAYQWSGNNTNPGDFTGIDRDSAISTYGMVYVIPTEDEWYKAAYYTGSGYSTYANGTDTAPVAGTDTNYDSAIGHPWEVGNGTIEQNGTFDMLGNVFEWNETLFGSGSNRGFRGGSYYSYYFGFLSSSYRSSSSPSEDFLDMGFRVASVPEPCSLVLLGLGGLTLMRRRRVR